MKETDRQRGIANIYAVISISWNEIEKRTTSSIYNAFTQHGFVLNSFSNGGLSCLVMKNLTLLELQELVKLRRVIKAYYMDAEKSAATGDVLATASRAILCGNSMNRVKDLLGDGHKVVGTYVDWFHSHFPPSVKLEKIERYAELAKESDTLEMGTADGIGKLRTALGISLGEENSVCVVG